MAKKLLKGFKQTTENNFSAETGWIYLVSKNGDSGYVQLDGKKYGENRQISTNINNDADSDVKTTSPKAVKTFVEGKGYGTYSKPNDGIPAEDLAQGVIPDVSGFITKSVNDLVNYYTTANTYTQTEVNALISAITQFHYDVYTTLPETGVNNVLYLIGPTGSGSDKYEEYVYPNSTTGWVKIGDTSIDLSGYVTTQALNTALANYTTTTDLTNLLSNKVDKVSGKGLSTNDYTTDEKNKLSGIESGAQKNAAGTVVDSSYVHTDNNFTTSEKNKLDGIESGAEANVQSNWNESDSASDAFIKNKPQNLVQDANYVHTDNNYTTTEKTKLNGIESSAQVNVLEGVKVNGTAQTITNKTVDISVPTALSQLSDDSTHRLVTDVEKAAYANHVSTTYSALKALRDGGNLVPGTWYRITDYNTYVSDIINNAQSAGHQFDILVLATDTNKLSEEARAIQHAGDTYFTNSDINAWELKYCIDNVRDKFNWALAPHSAGILVPDFISDVLTQTHNTINVDGYGTCYIFGTQAQAQEYWGEGDVYFCCESDNPVIGDTCMIVYYEEGGEIYYADESYEISNVISASDSNGKGVIYYLKDEFDNECHYDFKNIQFKRYKVTATSKTPLSSLVGCYISTGESMDNFTVDSSDYVWRYAFSTNDLNVGGNAVDSSLNGFVNGVYSNVISEYVKGAVRLNNIVFSGNYCYGNHFKTNCYDNTFGNSCNFNTFGNDCQYNTFGNSFQYNTFGNSCSSNQFGNECTYIHILKDYVYYIIVENGNKYIDITSTQTTSSSNKLMNFAISQGVNNTSTRKTISHNSVNDAFKTTYQSADSEIVNI